MTGPHTTALEPEATRFVRMQKSRDALDAQTQRLREEVAGLQDELRRVKQHSDQLQRAHDKAGAAPAASPDRGARVRCLLVLCCLVVHSQR